MKLLKILFYPIIQLFKYGQFLKSRWFLNKASKALNLSFKEQLKGRIALKREINFFLREFFGIGVKSKFIPPDYKNNEEVKMAVAAKFEGKMSRLNLSIEDVFK